MGNRQSAMTLQTTATGLVDLSNTPLAADYPNCYIKVLDNIFTPAECAAFIALAESDQQWQSAGLSSSGVVSGVNPNHRNSDQILRIDHQTADGIFQRILPHLQELVEIKPGTAWEGVVGAPGRVYGVWKLVGLYERLSFLRYGPGHFFKPHCDLQRQLRDGRKSRATLQIYLSEEGLSGGATRIHGKGRHYVDVEPKMGRVLIFQQQSIYHSGEQVTQGTKYTMRGDFMFEQIMD